MCGRFALTHAPRLLREKFGYPETPEFPPRYNIAPTQPVALVAGAPFTRGTQRQFLLARWGLLPAFVKEPFPLLLNARAETLMERPSFTPAFRRRRCLVPASGFYLFVDRQPYFVAPVDGAPLAFAGLYETYLHANGSEIDTVCIVTTAANALLSALGERMPAILPAEAFPLWLDHETTKLETAQDLLRPAPEALLQATPVERRVNNVRAEGPTLHDAVGAPIRFVRPVS